MKLRARGRSFSGIRGITLLESTHWLSASAVLAMSLISGVHGFFQDNQRGDVVNPLIGGLRLARQVALTGQIVTLCASTDGQRCDAQGDWSRGWLAAAEDGTPGGKVIARALNEHREIKVIADRAAYALAFSDRSLNADFSLGQLTVCDPRGGEQSRVVNVSLHDRPRVSAYDPAAGVCP